MTQTTYISIDGYQLFIKSIKVTDNEKENPTLIFLHDSWGCVDMWGEFPEIIAQKYNLSALVYDRRGYGRSEKFAIKERDKSYLRQSAEELHALMSKLNIQKAILYGHSDGASIATIAAQLYPQDIVAILLEGTHSFVEQKGKDAVRMSRDKSKTNNLLPSLRKYHGENTEELFRLWHETWLSEHFSDWNIVSELKLIVCPVLAFQGTNDEFGTEKQLETLRNEVKSTVLTFEIENAGHTPRKEQPTETLLLIDRFMQQIGLHNH